MAINEVEFFDCLDMMAAMFNNKLEETGMWETCGCRSLVHIKIPPVVRVIKEGAFFDCLGVMAVIFNNELEEVGGGHFMDAYPSKASRYPPPSGQSRKVHLFARV
jgi:hypothetical protein